MTDHHHHRTAMAYALERGDLTAACDMRDLWELEIIMGRGSLPRGWADRMTAVFGASGAVSRIEAAGTVDPDKLRAAMEARARAWGRVMEVVG
jgi:hypothetical protein